MDLPELALADSLWPADLARLADLETRSRDAGPFAYSAAVAEFERVVAKVPDLFAEVDHEAYRIAIRLWPDETREQIARNVLTRVALMGTDIKVLIPAESRMYLGRAWRKWMETLPRGRWEGLASS